MRWRRTPRGLGRAGDIWLRKPERALELLEARRRTGKLDGPGLALLSWLTLTHERDDKEAAVIAREALRLPGDTRFAVAALNEVLLGRDEHGEAVALLEAACCWFPTAFWYQLTLADTLVEARQDQRAVSVLEEATEHPRLRRHALKRLAQIAMRHDDRRQARQHLERLVALAPDYLVYASDFVLLGDLQLADGDHAAARASWHRGAELYPRNPQLRMLLSEHFDEDGPDVPPIVDFVDEGVVGAHRIPVRTPMITLRSGILEVIEPATAGLRRPGDVLALAESAVAAGQGRMLPLELVTPGPLARGLCRFVGKMGPLSSPEGMQGAVMEVGRARVLLGAVAGAAGRLFGRRGWFFRVAGQPTALIDDVAACMPPHDHHVIFGPGRPGALAEELASVLDCGVAIVDANHRSGAMVIGASAGVDWAWVERALADNPAGNADEQTPVVIIRPV